MNPDYAYWYGWAAMTKDLTEIREMAGDLRFKAKFQQKKEVKNDRETTGLQV